MSGEQETENNPEQFLSISYRGDQHSVPIAGNIEDLKHQLQKTVLPILKK